MVGAAELGAIPTAATVLLRVAERVYEVLAVTAQIRDLVDTTTQASKKLRNARILRRQRSRLLNQLEKVIVDDAFIATEKAIDIVARIIEPARADMDLSGGLEAGRVGAGKSILFVIRDSSKILVSHQKLMQASSDLNMAIITLNSKTGERSPVIADPASLDLSRLPTYHESQAMYRSRERNLRRRESALLRPQPLSDTVTLPPHPRPAPFFTTAVPDMPELPEHGPARSSPMLSTSSSCQDFDKIVVEEAIWSPDTPSPVHAFDVPPIAFAKQSSDIPLKGRARSRAWLAEWF